MSSNERSIGNAEMRLLTFIAERGPSTVREVWELYGAQVGYVRTTVQQMMERLRLKGFLHREKGLHGWRYVASQDQKDTQVSTVQRFVREMLGGSVSPFVHYLVEARDLSDEDISQLKALVARLEEQER